MVILPLAGEEMCGVTLFVSARIGACAWLCPLWLPALLNPPHCTPFCEFWGRALIAKEYKPQEQNPEPQK